MNILSMFSVKSLAEKIAKHELTDGTKLGLAMVFVGIMCAMAISFEQYNMQAVGSWGAQAHQVEGGVMYMPAAPDANVIIKKLFFYLLVIVGLVVPTMVLFHNDHIAHGKHFVERYMCLAVPLLIQSKILMIGAYLLSQIISYANYAYNVSLPKDALLGGIALVILVSFSWRLNTWLQYTAQKGQ